MEKWTVTTAENGQRALEFLGLGEGKCTTHTVSSNGFYTYYFFFLPHKKKKEVYIMRESWNYFAGIQGKLNNNRLLHARDDRIWPTEENQGEG